MKYESGLLMKKEIYYQAIRTSTIYLSYCESSPKKGIGYHNESSMTQFKPLETSCTALLKTKMCKVLLYFFVSAIYN